MLEVARWDALVAPPFRSSSLLPGARGAWVLGAGGRGLFAALQAAPEAGADLAHPLDTFVERVVRGAEEALRAAGFPSVAVFAHRSREGAFADFVGLAQACGLGWPSRLGLLLHPRYGPWWSLRAALLTRAPLTSTLPLPGPGPCQGCPAPCASACPAEAVSATGSAAPARFDVGRCAALRRRHPPCRLRCAARRACVVGGEEAYSEAAEAHHMAASWRVLCGSGPQAGP